MRNPRPTRVPRAPGRERGAVLIAALVILLILTVLGISGMQSTTLEERMAGNMRNRSLAFQGAEAALRVSEFSLTPAAATPLQASDFDGTDGLYQPAAPSAQDVWETVSWGTAAVRDAADDGALDIEDEYGLAANPEVVMEGPYMIPDPGGTLDPTEAATTELYRVTARSVGQSNDAVVILQSVFRP